MAGALLLAPGADEPDRSADASVEAQASGRLVFPPDYRGSVVVEDEAGRSVAEVALGQRIAVDLPPGRYLVRDAEGEAIETIELESDQVRSVELPSDWREPTAEAPARPREGVASSSSSEPAVATGRLGPAPPEAEQEVELVRRRRWTRWGAPLLSAIIPGSGQAINGQPGRGLAVFTGTVGLVLGTVAVAAARDPAEGATAGDPGRSGAQEVVRLTGLAGLSAAVGLLYLGQILDAHAQAVGRPITPMRGHALSLEVSRFATVGFSPGEPAYDLYPDWSLAIMGQVVPRVTVGLSDASIKLGSARGTVTVQAGARAAYRFFERRRVWLSAGGGCLLQGTRANGPAPLADDPETAAAEVDRAFSVVPYAHFDARLFLLDRWSLGLVPRVSVPLSSARRFGGGRALPRYATTFELGAVMGVYF
ncbi:MAG: hypothetical protein H6712_07190 [Myxococcales bacterium]|nr:hypothetical protein [Myxococcales bacterium]MCB9713618.1 hypothetical protein [Myxococcales bacterium]